MVEPSFLEYFVCAQIDNLNAYKPKLYARTFSGSFIYRGKMTVITILQFSPVSAYFCSGWGKSPISIAQEEIIAGIWPYSTKTSLQGIRSKVRPSRGCI